ncbi:MAG: tail assembly chaperone [Staphylococcus epidermidis]|nr:tail assembly chaperone [Staphylococcus epidermidis]
MEIKFNGKTIELSFGLKFLNIIDKEMGMEAEQVNFGKGTEMLVPALESHSVVDVAKVIKAATAQEKGAPKTEEDLEAVVEDVIENTGLEEFCNEVIEELGKRVLTQNLVPKKYKKNSKKLTKKKY